MSQKVDFAASMLIGVLVLCMEWGMLVGFSCCWGLQLVVFNVGVVWMGCWGCSCCCVVWVFAFGLVFCGWGGGVVLSVVFGCCLGCCCWLLPFILLCILLLLVFLLLLLLFYLRMVLLPLACLVFSLFSPGIALLSSLAGICLMP